MCLGIVGLWLFYYVVPVGGGVGGHWLVWMEWRLAGWSLYLPVLVSTCTIKFRSSFLAPAHPGGPRRRAVKRLCVVVSG